MSNDLLNTTLQESNIKSKIYTIRGVQVMLDSDLAEIYGYTTKRFNEQVKNNISKFPSDFMFQLTTEEVSLLSRSIFSTSIMQTKGVKGGSSYHLCKINNIPQKNQRGLTAQESPLFTFRSPKPNALLCHPNRSRNRGR